jgi:hypothetical protein
VLSDCCVSRRLDLPLSIPWKHYDLTDPLFRCFLSVYCSFDFSPEEVIKFCTDCVLSEDQEECDVPEAFYDLERLKP